MVCLFVLLAFTVVEWTSILLMVILLFLGFKVLETNWSYTISKPFAWENEVKAGRVSDAVRRLERNFRDKVRFYTFWLQIERLRNEATEGAFAELGVYRGETAKVIHAMEPGRKCYLFDTFAGFAADDLIADTIRSENRTVDFSATSLERVREYVHGNENVIFLPGHFPDTARELEDSFALVSLDADLYLPTLAGLQYFYPRLVKGGVIVVHDYNHTWDGVKKAVDEFMPTIPETLVEVSDWQGSVMIVKNK